jgi:quinol monooxygenase YgiN
MYIAYRKSKVDPKSVDEIVRRVNEGLVPILYNAFGFVSYEVFLDEEDNLCSVSIFATRAALEEANASAKEWAITNLSELLNSPIAISQGISLLERRRLERLTQ